MVKGKSSSLNGVYKFISKYEEKYNIKFGASEGLCLGNIDPRAKPHKLVWCERKATTNVNHIRRYAARGITPFDGVPYLFLGESFRRCIYGVYRYIKHFHNKRNTTQKSASRFRCRSSLFCGCPGIIVIREVYKFIDLKVPHNCHKLRVSKGRQFAQKWADGEIDGQRWFYFYISPLREHENHDVPGAGGCTVEPFSEDKLVILDEEGEVIDFEIHDPYNPSADPTGSESSISPKRSRLERSSNTTIEKDISHANPGIQSFDAPATTLSYEDSLLNHVPKPYFSCPVSQPVPVSVVHTSTIPPVKANAIPVFNAVAYRPIQSKNVSVAQKSGEGIRSTLVPVAMPVATKVTATNQTVRVAPTKVVPLKKDSTNQINILNQSTSKLLKDDLAQFQKRTDARLSAVEHRMSSIESRMASLESAMLQISAQLQTVQDLLETRSASDRTLPSAHSHRPNVNLNAEPVLPTELDFTCLSHDEVHLEPFSPSSSCDVSPK